MRYYYFQNLAISLYIAAQIVKPKVIYKTYKPVSISLHVSPVTSILSEPKKNGTSLEAKTK
jgi:hypothetical protein